MNKTTIRLPDDLHRDLHAAAARQGWSASHVIRELVKVWLRSQQQNNPDRKGAV